MKINRKIIDLVLIVMVTLVFSRCATFGKIIRKPIYPNQVQDAWQTAFNAAEQNYKQASYDSALKGYQDYLSYPYNKLSDESSYKIGKIYFIQQNWDAAISDFETLAQKTPDPAYRAKAYLMGAYSAFQKEDFAKSDSLVGKVKINDLPTKLQIHFYSLNIFLADKLSKAKEESDYNYLRLVDLYEESNDPSLKELSAPEIIASASAMERLHSWVISPISSDAIPHWIKDYPDGYSKAYVDYKWGKIYYEAGNTEEARRHFTHFIRSYPKNEYVSSAKKLLQKLGGPAAGVSNDDNALRVGVLLPLSGAQSAFGQAILWGVQCAAGQQAGCGEVQKVTLVQKDLGTATPEDVAKMVDQLADEENVSVIIGPISGPLAEAAAKKAQQKKVVLFPITQKEGVMSIGNFIFQMGYKAHDQIHDLVLLARKRGLKSFGIFYPNINYGDELAIIFQDEVKANGGTIAAKSSYNTASNELGEDARKLKMSISRYSYNGGNAGFDAVFVPDSYRSLAKVSSGLQFVSIKDIPLLGTNAWNDSRFSSDVANSFPGSFFIDLFYTGSSSPRGAQFVNAYHDSFGRTPTSLEALGFDAMAFTLQAVEAGGSTKPDKIRDDLLSNENLVGVTRIHAFKEGEGPVVSPISLTITSTGIVPLR